MKLRHRVDDLGVLWFDNPVVTVWEQFVRGLGVIAAGCWVLAGVLVVGAWPSLALLGNAVFDFLLAMAVLCTAWYGYRQTRPRYGPQVPRSIGFSSTDRHVPEADGSVLRVPWREIRDVQIERGSELTTQVTLDCGGSPVRIVSLNLDIAIKVRWARRLAARAALSTSALVEPFRPTFPLRSLPPGGIFVDASPKLVLYPDGVVLWEKERGQEFPREDVDLVVFPLMKENRFVVTIRGHQAAFILHESEARRLLDWFEWERLTTSV